ncbi:MULTISPECIES: DoxX family protein [unclassified Haladaptatus]|uniref:DoxX family protein n=1 Tax=unclassified Haladaptatus TaxID=2622732 RepID=UPI0023E7B5EB|nr:MULTISPECIES: DoxX family protein [unclassified Haladaptatus]
MTSESSTATTLSQFDTNRLATPALVILRVTLGWVFFYAGITKVIDPTWTAAGYLENAVPAGNPFAFIWPTLAGLPAVDLLVQWGLTLTGLCLILGAFVRWSALWASVMMATFWASSLPLSHGIVVDEHIVYILSLGCLSAFGAGRIAGLDGKLEQSAVVSENRWLRYLLG